MNRTIVDIVCQWDEAVLGWIAALDGIAESRLACRIVFFPVICVQIPCNDMITKSA